MAETTKATLPKEVFAVEVPNHELLKRAYNSYLANTRVVAPGTKTRGLVSGGGKKPWKQKGTGRARFGSSRNPIWRGGGVVFGPTGNENYRIRLSKTSKHVAVKQALSLANAAKKIVVIETFSCPGGKTKETLKMLADNKIESTATVLLVVSEKNDLVIRATNNLQNIKVVRPTYLSVFDILNADKVVIEKKSIPMIQQWLIAANRSESEEA